MKSPNYLKFLALGTGIGGCALRITLYLTGLDRKGLPVAGHWAQNGLLILTAAVFVFFLLITRTIQGSQDYRSAYPRSVVSGIGCLIAAFAFFMSDLPDAMLGSFHTPELVLRCGAVFSLCFVAFCRFAGRKPPFLFHGISCLYLVLRMICLYRLWSPDPQLIDYGFYLGAYISLILTCYQFAAFDADCGSHKKLWFWGLVSVYLCGVSLSGNQEPLFLLLCMVWVLTNLSNPEAEIPAADAAEGV